MIIDHRGLPANESLAFSDVIIDHLGLPANEDCLLGAANAAPTPPAKDVPDTEKTGAQRLRGARGSLDAETQTYPT